MADESEAKAAVLSEGGAFVEIDEHKLDRGGLYMLGCKDTLDIWISEYEHRLAHVPNPVWGEMLRSVIAELKSNRDTLAVGLTRHAVKLKAGTIHGADGKRMNIQ